MGQQGKMIADSAARGIGYAERLMKGLPDDRFARMSSPGGQQVDANHPAFIFGHLCLYPQKVMEHIGASTEQTRVPESFDAVFSKTAKCQDDADGTIYPSAEVIKETFCRTYAAALEAIAECDDSILGKDNPDEAMNSVFPTMGSMLNFYLTSHVMVHLGQLSTWRRMEGMPPA